MVSCFVKKCFALRNLKKVKWRKWLHQFFNRSPCCYFLVTLSLLSKKVLNIPTKLFVFFETTRTAYSGCALAAWHERQAAEQWYVVVKGRVENSCVVCKLNLVLNQNTITEVTCCVLCFRIPHQQRKDGVSENLKVFDFEWHTDP